MDTVAKRLPVVGVLGSGQEAHQALADPLGSRLAGLGVHLLTGGGGGVMASVSRAFFAVPDRAGLVIGILPSRSYPPKAASKPGYPNPWIEVPIYTHLPLSGTRGRESMSRNHINVLTSDVLIALPGGSGTLSEVLLADRYGKPLVAFLHEPAALPGLPGHTPVTADLEEVVAFVVQHLRSIEGRSAP